MKQEPDYREWPEAACTRVDGTSLARSEGSREPEGAAICGGPWRRSDSTARFERRWARRFSARPRKGARRVCCEGRATTAIPKRRSRVFKSLSRPWGPTSVNSNMLPLDQPGPFRSSQAGPRSTRDHAGRSRAEIQASAATMRPRCRSRDAVALTTVSRVEIHVAPEGCMPTEFRLVPTIWVWRSSEWMFGASCEVGGSAACAGDAMPSSWREVV